MWPIYLHPDGIVDLKQTEDLSARRFTAQAFDLAYHGQLAFYRRGLRALGMADPVCWVVAVESSPPHDVGVWRVDESVLSAGDELVTSALAKLVECRKRDRWPGRYPEEQTLLLPAWAYGTETDDANGAEGLVVGGAVNA